MSIARSFLLVLSVASTPLLPLASLGMSAGEAERGVTWTRDTFSAFLERLRELKTKWDPDNFFRQNVNILPQPGGRA